MRQGCLVPNIAEVALVCLRPKDGAIEMQLRARRSISTCPACGTASRRVHSHYQRKLADLPWEGLPVVILLQARKFFCVGDSCRPTPPQPKDTLVLSAGENGFADNQGGQSQLSTSRSTLHKRVHQM